MAWVAYDAFKVNQFSSGLKPIDFSSTGDTIKVMLCTATYSPNQTTHATKADVTNEVSGSNYAAGGVTLTQKTATVSSHVLTFLSTSITWSQHASGFSNARIAVMYRSTGGADNVSVLIAYYDLASDRGNVAGDLVLGDPSGHFTI